MNDMVFSNTTITRQWYENTLCNAKISVKKLPLRGNSKKGISGACVIRLNRTCPCVELSISDSPWILPKKFTRSQK